MKFNGLISFIIAVLLSNNGLAGITGSICGRLLDKDTKQGLPGATVSVVDTRLEAVTDKYGHYSINHVPPGSYDLRAKMLGYATMLIKDVNVRADYNTEINIEMTNEPLAGPEIVITAEKPFIQKDLPASIHTLNASDLSRRLPIDNFHQTLRMQPGVVNGHIRGGRNYDALYLVDGHSIQDPMFREISALVPLSSISELNFLPGGFSAEYGQAMSGVVNLSTKEGKEKTEAFFKFYTDNLGLHVKNDNLQRLELSLGGPLLLSFGGPMYDLNYFVSGTMNFGNVKFADYQNQVAPGNQNYHYTTKLTFRLWQKIKIIFQSISSNWQLSDNETFRHSTGNEKKSIDQKKESERLNLTIIHTLNPNSFYTFSFGKDIIKKQIFNKIMTGEPGAGNSKINGNGTVYDWNNLFREKNYFLKAAYYHQLSHSSLMQIGTDVNSYRLFMNNFIVSQLYDDIASDVYHAATPDLLRVNPLLAAVFAQNKLTYNNLIVNVGLRLDYFNPDITFPAKTMVSPEDTVRLAPQRGNSQFQLSPRIGMSFPFLLRHDRVHLNYGWFFQIPPLYYFYMNSQQNITSRFSLVGNPNLMAEKTEAFEIGYQKSFGKSSGLGSNFFIKNIENLVNIHRYYSGGSDPEGYSQFDNVDRASIKGLELYFEKRPGNDNLSGRISYTYCKALGTGSFPLQNYYSFEQRSMTGSSLQQYPLAWDQRHKLSANISYAHPGKFEIDLLAQLHSPLPLLDERFRTMGRGKWRSYIDCRFVKSFPLSRANGKLSLYFEILNLLNDREQNLQFNPYYLINDNFWMLGLNSYQYEYGRRIRAGLIISFK